jgi:hypothetical protein
MPRWPAWANLTSTAQEDTLGLEGQIDSPVLRRWLQGPPNLLEEIRNTPALPTRLQAGFESASAWRIALQDLRLGDRLTLSGDYRQSSENPVVRQYGLEVRYFLTPMGSRFNLAPQLGYRTLELEQENRRLRGVSYGAFVVLSLALQAADLTASYTWLTPQEPREVQVTLAELTAAYAISPSFRLAARYSLRHSTLARESSFGVGLEWIP